MNYRRISYSPKSCSFHCDPSNQIETQQGLAVSPAQVDTLTKSGMTVNSTNALSFIDGVPNPSFDIPIEQRRGIDVADVWQASQNAKKKLYNSHISDVKLYGE